MSYPVHLASILTGATTSQLRSWSQKGLLVPEISDKRPPLYSFRDLVALRSLVFLRGNTSLQKISKAFKNLDLLDLTDHPSKYRFTTDGKTILVDTGDGSVIDLVGKPGQRDSYTFEEIMDAFKDFRGRDVVDFRKPSKFVRVNFRLMGGWPTVVGTRVPYDLVASLVDNETVFAEDVPSYYPSVSVEATRDVIEFDHRVKAAGA